MKSEKYRQKKPEAKKIVYVGHSYHNKTKSTEFLTNYLNQFFDMEIILDESWQGKSLSDLSFVDGSYLAVIFFQVLPPREIYEKIKSDNIVYFPMYDQSGQLDRDFWDSYPNIKIINFSKTLHEKLKKWGFNSMHTQYFPEPEEFTPGKNDEVFFWQRITKININTITKLFKKGKLKIHIHKGIDPNQEFVRPSREDEENYRITYSNWFESRDEMWDKIGKLIKQKGIYVAPRELEGIGLSFLEAMAMGKAVVAVNNPTMNEYIKHNITGYLFDLFTPKKIDLSNLEQVQKNAYKFMVEGRKRWEKDKRKIIDFIKEGHSDDSEKKETPLVNIITVAHNAKDDLEKTIRSVLAQDYPNMNYIVIDGGSTDGTMEMLEKYRGKIGVLISEKDNGIYEAMNKGISKAKEGYLNFLNAGDEFLANDVISNIFRGIGDRYDMIYGKIVVGEVTEEKLKHPQETKNFTRENILLHNTAVLCHQAMFLKKGKTPFYDNSYKIKGDLDWYFEIFDKNPNLSYRRSEVVVTNYKGGGISEKKYFLDIYELVKLIIKRFGLSSFLKYGYHVYAVKRICRENKFANKTLKLLKLLKSKLYSFRGPLIAIAKKMFRKISPAYRKINDAIVPELNAIDFRLNVAELETSDIKTDLGSIEPALNSVILEINAIEDRLGRLMGDDFPIENKIIEKERGFSHLNEEKIIEKYLNSLPKTNRYCVDIAASDGMTMSNTLFLYKKGWSGLAVEFDPDKFSKLALLYKDFENVNLVKAKVVPDNIVSLLKSCLCPVDFAFLNFDIDSYDFFVLEQLLSEFRPSLICMEINESIPPPILFTVKYDPDHFWEVNHFFGQSISKCHELCGKYNYDIVELHYNNLFLVPKEINIFESLSPERAYKEGYKNKTDRKEKFPWNSDMEELLTMPKDKGIEFLNKRFEKYSGKYILE